MTEELQKKLTPDNVTLESIGDEYVLSIEKLKTQKMYSRALSLFF